MEIVVTGRHAQVSDRFREHLDEKLAKVPQLAPRVQRLDVVVTHEVNPRQSKECDKVEITCHVKGPVIRAEACAVDKYAALDVAIDKLFERLRRAHDRKRVHRGRRAPESVARATARTASADEPQPLAGVLVGSPMTGLKIAGSDGSADAAAAGDRAEFAGDTDLGLDSPIEVREKVHATSPMTLDQALYEMELVGHDFYLFHDSETDRPSVVYRRRGWSYGVIHLEVTPAAAAAVASDDDGSQVRYLSDDRIAAQVG